MTFVFITALTFANKDSAATSSDLDDQWPMSPGFNLLINFFVLSNFTFPLIKFIDYYPLLIYISIYYSSVLIIL